MVSISTRESPCSRRHNRSPPRPFRVRHRRGGSRPGPLGPSHALVAHALNAPVGLPPLTTTPRRSRHPGVDGCRCARRSPNPGVREPCTAAGPARGRPGRARNLRGRRNTSVRWSSYAIEPFRRRFVSARARDEDREAATGGLRSFTERVQIARVRRSGHLLPQAATPDTAPNSAPRLVTKRVEIYLIGTACCSFCVAASTEPAPTKVVE